VSSLARDVTLQVPEVQASNPDRPSPLTRQRVLAAAVHLADREGIDAVSMRRLGQEVGVEAMSLYTHVRDKEDLLGGMVDSVVAEIGLPPAGADWKPSLRRTVLGAREVILRHRWAPPVIETRASPGPATLRYLDAVMGILRGGGLSLALTRHALPPSLGNPVWETLSVVMRTA